MNDYDCSIVKSKNVSSDTKSAYCNYINQELSVFLERRSKVLENKKVQELLSSPMKEYIAGEEDGYVTEERLEGIKKLCDEKKLKLTVRCGQFSELRARQLTMRFAKNNDCVVCASDLMAIGAMKALIDMDIFRPVCGFDGIILMGYVGKQMNTLRQDFVKISEIALDELWRLMQGEKGRKVTVPHTMVRMKYEDIIK